ncbi:MAG: EAL domain-containing protein [Microthrixaceae bacterium]
MALDTIHDPPDPTEVEAATDLVRELHRVAASIGMAEVELECIGRERRLLDMAGPPPVGRREELCRRAAAVRFDRGQVVEGFGELMAGIRGADPDSLDAVATDVIVALQRHRLDAHTASDLEAAWVDLRQRELQAPWPMWCLTVLGALRLVAGDLVTARTYLRRADRVLGARPRPIACDLVAGRVAIESGDPERAYEHFRVAVEGHSPDDRVRLMAEAGLGEALVELGHTEHARQPLAEAISFEVGDPMSLARCHELLARIAAGDERFREAYEHLRITRRLEHEVFAQQTEALNEQRALVERFTRLSATGDPEGSMPEGDGGDPPRGLDEGPRVDGGLLDLTTRVDVVAAPLGDPATEQESSAPAEPTVPVAVAGSVAVVAAASSVPVSFAVPAPPRPEEPAPPAERIPTPTVEMPRIVVEYVPMDGDPEGDRQRESATSVAPPVLPPPHQVVPQWVQELRAGAEDVGTDPPDVDPPAVDPVEAVPLDAGSADVLTADVDPDDSASVGSVTPTVSETLSVLDTSWTADSPEWMAPSSSWPSAQEQLEALASAYHELNLAAAAALSDPEAEPHPKPEPEPVAIEHGSGVPEPEPDTSTLEQTPEPEPDTSTLEQTPDSEPDPGPEPERSGHAVDPIHPAEPTEPTEQSAAPVPPAVDPVVDLRDVMRRPRPDTAALYTAATFLDDRLGSGEFDLDLLPAVTNSSGGTWGYVVTLVEVGADGVRTAAFDRPGACGDPEFAGRLTVWTIDRTLDLLSVLEPAAHLDDRLRVVIPLPRRQAVTRLLDAVESAASKDPGAMASIVLEMDSRDVADLHRGDRPVLGALRATGVTLGVRGLGNDPRATEIVLDHRCSTVRLSSGLFSDRHRGSSGRRGEVGERLVLRDLRSLATSFSIAVIADGIDDEEARRRQLIAGCDAFCGSMAGPAVEYAAVAGSARRGGRTLG